MNRTEARDALLLYRPGTVDAADPRIAEALKWVARDPELKRWFDQHRAFQEAMRTKFRNIEVPAGLKDSLLNRRRRSRRSPRGDVRQVKTST